MTLWPTPTDTVTIRTLSCCVKLTLHHVYDQTPNFCCPGWFPRRWIVTVAICPPARVGWGTLNRSPLTHAYVVVCWVCLTMLRVRLGYGLRLADQCIGAVLSSCIVLFLIFYERHLCAVFRTVLPAPGRTENSYVLWSADSHDCLDRFWEVELSSLGVAGQSDLYGARLSQNVNFFCSNLFSVGCCGLECHSVWGGSGLMIMAPILPLL